MAFSLSFEMYDVSIELNHILINIFNYFNTITNTLDFKLIIETLILVFLILNIIIIVSKKHRQVVIVAVDQQQQPNNATGTAVVVQHIVQMQHQQPVAGVCQYSVILVII